MAYIINKFNGEQLLVLEDGTLNTDTSVGLLGKNTIGYGEVQNENFIFLLENFAGSAPPSGTVLTGQVYFNVDKNQLNVYDGTNWNVVGNAIVSDSEPSSTIEGSLWIKNTTDQLYVYKNGWTLIGPQAVEGFGLTQAEAAVLEDTVGTNHAVLKMVADGDVIAICSSDTFTIADSNAVPGFTTLRRGITLSTNADIKGSLDGNASSATKLLNSRNINGVAFDGTENITVKSSTTFKHVRGEYLKGSDFDGSVDVQWDVNASSVNSPGTVVARNADGDFAAGKIQATLQGDVEGNVSILTGTSQFNDVVARRFEGNFAGTLFGTATEAEKFSNARTINGVAFDGTGNITIKAASPEPLVPGQYVDGSNYDGSTGKSWNVLATPNLDPDKIVARDSNGDFSAGTITSDLIGDVQGNVTTQTGVSTFNIVRADDFVGNLTGSVTGNAGTASRLLFAQQINGVEFDGTAPITITSNTEYSLVRGSYLTGDTFNGSAGTTWSVDASSNNVANKVVVRDSSGNFSAGNVTASRFYGPLSGNVTGNLTGSTNGTHTGNVIGNVAGNVTGNVTGTASGNVKKTGDTMSGRLTVPAGPSGGIGFPPNPFGGSGDLVTFTVESAGGERMRARIRVTNDSGSSVDDKFEFVVPDNNSVLINGHKVYHAGNDGSGSGLDADLLDGQNSSYYASVAYVDNKVAASIPSLEGRVSTTGDSMTGYLTLNGNPVSGNHAATKAYVDAVAATGYTFTYGSNYSTSGYTNQVGSFNNSRNYFDIYPPAGKTMSNLVAFIPSIHVVHYAGGVDGNDSIRCVYTKYYNRIRVWVQNTEQRSTPAANWLAVWR